MISFNNLDLITSVELANMETEILDDSGKATGAKKQCFHFLYGSQLYGTLFAIFGRFTTQPSATPNAVDVTAISLRLFNYQGLLNMGFAKKGPVYQEHDDDPRDPDVFGKRTVTVYLKGGSGILEKVLLLEKGELTVPKGQRTRLIMKRILFPLNNFGVGFHPDRDLPTPDESDIIWDTEFHYRNGITHRHQYLREGMAETTDNGKLTEAEEKDFNIMFPAHRCLTANINLLY